jgi:hypothetical protein
MPQKRKIAMVVRKGSFAEAAEADIQYYASITWKESAASAEAMRRMIWSSEYINQDKVRKVAVAQLKEDRDDVE